MDDANRFASMPLVAGERSREPAVESLHGRIENTPSRVEMLGPKGVWIAGQTGARERDLVGPDTQRAGNLMRLHRLIFATAKGRPIIRAASLGHKQSVYTVRAARGTRAELQELLLKGVVPALLRLALVEKDSAAKQWAGMMLASIGESIKKYDKKLGNVNAAYGEEQKKIRGEKQLGQVVVSPKPIMKTVQRELIKAEDRRRALLRLKEVFRRTWRQSENLQGLED
jgi:hypothetical protein